MLTNTGEQPATLEATMSALRKAQFEHDEQLPPPVCETSQQLARTEREVVAFQGELKSRLGDLS